MKSPFAPLTSYAAKEIEDVWLGKWEVPEDAAGVVVKMGGKEIHIGTKIYTQII